MQFTFGPFTFDGTTAFGEDHDNWSAASLRRFSRRHQGWA